MYEQGHVQSISVWINILTHSLKLMVDHKSRVCQQKTEIEKQCILVKKISKLVGGDRQHMEEKYY